MADAFYQRPPLGMAFDEAWYLKTYTDVALAIERNGFCSGWHHYLTCGQYEGRITLPPDHVAPTPDDDDRNREFRSHNGAGFMTPDDLAVTETHLRRIALVGSCMMEGWGFHTRGTTTCPIDLIVVNNRSKLPELPEEVLESYDFQFVQVPLPGMLRDESLWHLPYADLDAHEELFRLACKRLEDWLHFTMLWNRERGLLTFVANFFTPQQNPVGRLFPRFDLRNAEYFIDRLNQHLESVVRREQNAYVLDIDRLSASLGRRFLQDDLINPIAHNTQLQLLNPDDTRIEPLAGLRDYYDVGSHGQFPSLVWAELMAMYRTVRQIDQVKLIAVDLDDTLWRGISGDMAEIDDSIVLGWPAGVAEALAYAKKRGILLAIISRNEESRIREIWPRIFGSRLRLDDFAAIRINWQPKPESMREILEGANLLSRSVVFIDDNPAERAAMQQAYPDMRILGRNPYYLKRILLWSAETQVAFVSDESSRRTEMMKAQFTRETERKAKPRDQFLHDAAPKLTLFTIDDTAHPRFERVFELLNKTNQFNTTGRRWSREEIGTWLRTGGKVLAFEVVDNFTSYGLVGVVLHDDNQIEQWVMSCRVLGYQVEQAVMSVITAAMRAHAASVITGRMVWTDVNFPCRDLFRDTGFTGPEGSGDWTLAPDVAIAVPEHVSIA